MRSFFMKFEVCILGCGAATPTLRRNPTAQVINVHDKLFLVDCAEGTQLQLRRFKVKFQRIHHIFISHLHGDHYLGLIGLLSSMHLLGRKKDIHIYGPAPLEDLIHQNLKVSDTYLNFQIFFHSTNPNGKEKIYADKTLEVFSFPLKHRIACTGFLFTELKRKPKVRKEVIEQYKLGVAAIRMLKNREDLILESGEVLSYSDATIENPSPRSYAFCSDTAYLPSLKETIGPVELLYHESTFLNQHEKRAKETFHSTAEQAGQIAKELNAQKLILGHFSSRYVKLDEFLEEAKAHFQNTHIAEDGISFGVPYR